MGRDGDSSRQNKSKKRYRSDGTSVWTRPAIDGAGVWITCIKGKERQAIGENYDLFESIADELWPGSGVAPEAEEAAGSGGEDIDIEKAIAKEVSTMKRPRKEKWFSSCHTETACLLFISCKPPVDPVKLITHHMQAVQQTGITHTRATHRYVPVSGSCDVNIAEITSLCKRIVVPAFSPELGAAGTEGNDPEETKGIKYKIELRQRNQNSVSREEVIKAVAACIPMHHTVDLSDPELFILVELFKSTCGMSVVRDYYKLKKFNVVELAQMKMVEEGET